MPPKKNRVPLHLRKTLASYKQRTNAEATRAQNAAVKEQQRWIKARKGLK